MVKYLIIFSVKLNHKNLNKNFCYLTAQLNCIEKDDKGRVKLKIRNNLKAFKKIVLTSQLRK